MVNAIDQYCLVASKWITNPCSVDIRFVAEKTDSQETFQVILARVSFYPFHLKNKEEFSFEINAGDFWFGQQQFTDVAAETAISMLREAADGKVAVYGKALRLSDMSIGFPQRVAAPNEWLNTLGLRVRTSISQNDALLRRDENQSLDDALRRASPPFDGMSDLCNWLNFPNLLQSQIPGTIEIHVDTPIDVVFEQSSVADGRVNVTLVSHSNLDVSTIGLAVYGVPSLGVTGRRQVRVEEIQWDAPIDHKRFGKASIEIPGIDAALVMLSLGDVYVRRQWFTDPIRSRNLRLLSTRHFDRDLKMVRRYLLDEAHQDKFELAIAAIAHLSGYSAMVQLEKDAPDLIVTTPSGQIAIVECTIRTADIPAKVGKLVDRREALNKTLSTGGRQTTVLAILACQLDKDQIAATQYEMALKGVLLVPKESLNRQLYWLNEPGDPDTQYGRLLQLLSRLRTAQSGQPSEN